MRLDLVTARDVSLEIETGDRGADLEPRVIALIDRRGRRLLVPMRGRLQRHQPCLMTAGAYPVLDVDGGFTSGAIH